MKTKSDVVDIIETQMQKICYGKLDYMLYSFIAQSVYLHVLLSLQRKERLYSSSY